MSFKFKPEDIFALEKARAAVRAHVRNRTLEVIDFAPAEELLTNLIESLRLEFPRLPTGWVEHSDEGNTTVLWHDNGFLYRDKEKKQKTGRVGDYYYPHLSLKPIGGN